jgi:hypothetical protein
MSTDTTDYGEVIIDGYHFKLFQNSDVQASAVDRFPGKITVGDYTLDSNDLLSTINISDLSGGNGVVDHIEGTTDNRYRISTIYTRYPRQFTKPYRVTKYLEISGAIHYPLGDMYDYANSRYDFYHAYYSTNTFLTNFYKNGVDTTSDLTAIPTSKGVAYRGAGADTFFYVPMGASGYATYEPDGPTFTNVGAEDMVAFCTWDDKLIGIDVNGQLYYATSAAATTTFTSYGAGGKLDRAIVPKSLVVYRNQANENHVHVVTDSGVFAFDPATPRLYEIPDLTSVHPYFGIAAAKWRGNLFVAAGMDILEYNGSVIRNIGLSRDDGLPFANQQAARVIDLVAGQNSLYAYVRSTPVVAANDNGAIYEWSGFGWHLLFDETVDDLVYPTWMHVSRQLGNYRLFWGLGDEVWHQALPVSFMNPQEAIASGAGHEFGRNAIDTYYLETGKYDFGMPGYQKIANGVEVDVSRKVSTDTITIKYRTDFETSWTTLGTCTATGHNRLPFGTVTADGIYPGITFETIELRLEYAESMSTTDTDVVKSMVLSGLKVMNPSWSWTVQLDLTSAHSGYSPEQMFDKLVALKNSGVFYSMKHWDDTYRIRIAGMNGAQETGKDKRGVYTLSLLEIPQKLGAPV